MPSSWLLSHLSHYLNYFRQYPRGLKIRSVPLAVPGPWFDGELYVLSDIGLYSLNLVALPSVPYLISSNRWLLARPRAKPPGTKLDKGSADEHPPFWGPGGFSPQSQKQDGVDGPKVKNKMASMGQNSKTRWRRWAKSQKKMAAKGI